MLLWACGASVCRREREMRLASCSCDSAVLPCTGCQACSADKAAAELTHEVVVRLEVALDGVDDQYDQVAAAVQELRAGHVRHLQQHVMGVLLVSVVHLWLRHTLMRIASRHTALCSVDKME